MTETFPTALPLAESGDPVRYVVIDDEPRYRTGLGAPPGPGSDLVLEQVGGYPDVESFFAFQRTPCHVVVLDLCLNRRTGDLAVLHGVRAVRRITGDLGQRVLVYTADARPEPVARCVAAGAAGYVSKYHDDPQALVTAVVEIASYGHVQHSGLTDALLQLARRCRDVRLSATLEATLVLLGHGLSDAEIARRRHLSVRTVGDHKRKILGLFGADMEAREQGFTGLTTDLGIASGDLVNDQAGSRPARGLIRRGLSWASRPRKRSPWGA
ncbi:MAG: response regulator transcription factor [Dactylosporangium sp.]|nr:response regulator transcription factor [Dactylosporangium sp.]NNJ63122.1 response regulator transcription factor [Dactylosporangium sp.]